MAINLRDFTAKFSNAVTSPYAKDSALVRDLGRFGKKFETVFSQAVFYPSVGTAWANVFHGILAEWMKQQVRLCLDRMPNRVKLLNILHVGFVGTYSINNHLVRKNGLYGQHNDPEADRFPDPSPCLGRRLVMIGAPAEVRFLLFNMRCICIFENAAALGPTEWMRRETECGRTGRGRKLNLLDHLSVLA